jgi:hypothetical protein
MLSNYEIKPYKTIGTTSWAVFKDNFPFFTGLTREQAERKKDYLENKEKQNYGNQKTFLFS